MGCRVFRFDFREPPYGARWFRRGGGALSLAVALFVSISPAFAQQGKPQNKAVRKPAAPMRPWVDLIRLLDIYNPRYVHKSGDWSRDETTVTLESIGSLGLPFEPQLRHRDEDPVESRYRLELEVERLGPGPLFLAFPVGQVDSFGVVSVAIDFQGGSGPCIVDGKAFSANRLWRKHERPMLLDRQRVVVRCEVISLEGRAGELTVTAGDVEVYRGPIDAATMAAAVDARSSDGVEFDPRFRLAIGGKGRFRFTRLATQGRGGLFSAGDPREPLTKAPTPAPPRAKPDRATRTPPVAEMAAGIWTVRPLDEHIRFQWAKLHVVSSNQGDVRGVVQWTGPDKERAYEIVRGQIIGDALTLHGLDQQRYLMHLGIARYRGKLSADGRRFSDVETIVDGRQVRDETTNERFEAVWEGPETAVGRGAQAAFDALFRSQSDEEDICKQFTDYSFLTEHEGRVIVRAHQADRIALLRLSSSSNPHVRAAALGMMQGELMRDARNARADISDAVAIAQSASSGLAGKLLELDAAQSDATSRASATIPDPQAARAAIDRINSEHAEATSRLFNAAFNNPGIQSIYLNDIQRTKLSAAGFKLSQAVNQRVRAMLRERPSPAEPLANAWGQRLEGGYSTIDVVLSNLSPQTLEHCVFVTEFQVDPEKSRADREKQVVNERVVGGLARLTMGLDRDATDIAESDSEARYQLLLCDTSSLVWLPQWRPGEKIRIKLAKTPAASWGKAASLSVWTNQTGLKESKLALPSIVAEAKRANQALQKMQRRGR